MINASGDLSLRAIKAAREWTPRSRLGWAVSRCLPHLPPDLAAELLDRIQSACVIETSLSVQVMRGYGLFLKGWLPFSEVAFEEWGVVGRKVVTDVGVAYIVDAFQNLTEVENQKFHGLCTGSTAESVGDTALVTELTTEYTGNVRATGTTTEGASGNIYRTVATNTLDGTPGQALREHGIFNASTSGVLLDRTVYSAITLSSGDSLATTYDLTLTSGS